MKAMRRSERQMDSAETMNLLSGGEYGILSTVNEMGEPYGTPVNYIVYKNALYIHCANVGSKLDNILNNNSVCFTVVGNTKVLPDQFGTLYESVVVFGKAIILADEDGEKESALKEIIKKYSPDFINEGNVYIEKAKARTKVVKIVIGNLSGKHRE